MRISDWSSDVCSSDLAADATETIERARQHRPDVVVLDLVMTGSVGLSTARALLADEPFRPVLVISSLFDPMIEQEAISRSEERRVGKEWVSKCRSGWSPYL